MTNYQMLALSLCFKELILFPCSRDAQIRQLELDLAAAPKQEKVERWVVCFNHVPKFIVKFVAADWRLS